MDAFSEAPECEWPILHASEAGRYSSAATGGFVAGPSNDDEDQLPFIFNNPGEMLMRELDPPVHLLSDDSLGMMCQYSTVDTVQYRVCCTLNCVPLHY